MIQAKFNSMQIYTFRINFRLYTVQPETEGAWMRSEIGYRPFQRRIFIPFEIQFPTCTISQSNALKCSNSIQGSFSSFTSPGGDPVDKQSLYGFVHF